MSGPLSGIKVVEFEAIGPGPFAGMLLADMGADVILVDRPGGSDLGLKRERWNDVMMRGKRSVTLDLKSAGGIEAAQGLIERADALIEGFRPGVMERLGIGPDAALAKNPRLVYGRMTGWGQDGPLAPRAGHDINYIALAGVLHAFGRKGEAPVPPLNLIGDFGGGGMLLGFGVACALLEAKRSGKGQVVDAAMIDGTALLAAMFSGFLAAGTWSETRGDNILDTGAPWYDVYETKDGKYVSIGSIEGRFYEELLSRLELKSLPDQNDRARWPEMVVNGNVTRTDIPVLMTTAEWDNARYTRAYAELFHELVVEHGVVPRYLQSLGHNHSSQLLSVGTTDRSVSATIVDFIEQTVQRR